MLHDVWTQIQFSQHGLPAFIQPHTTYSIYWAYHVISNPESLWVHLVLGAVSFCLQSAVGMVLLQYHAVSCVDQRCWVQSLRWMGREKRGSRAQSSGWARKWIWAMDLVDSSRALCHPLLCLLLYLFLLHLLSLPRLHALPVLQSSPAFPGWEEAWSRVSPFSVWSLALLPSHWCSWGQ